MTNLTIEKVLNDNSLMRPYPLGPMCPNRDRFFSSHILRKRGLEWYCEKCGYRIEYNQKTYDKWKNTKTMKDVDELLKEGIEIRVCEGTKSR